MNVFALGDPHLSFAAPKPMDVFGSAWREHPARIERAWRAAVGEDDLVLVPGDVSWAMRLEEARADLEWLAALPGRKVLARGNHDYWWTSPAKMRAAVPGLDFVQNDAVRVGQVAIGGARLWDFPGFDWPLPAGGGAAPAAAPRRDKGGHAHDQGLDPGKIRRREIERLRLSLARLPRDGDVVRVCLTHYPPLGADGRPTEITRLIASFGVTWCVFGHIHGHSPAGLPPGADADCEGLRCVLASADALDFAPRRLFSL